MIKKTIFAIIIFLLLRPAISFSQIAAQEQAVQSAASEEAIVVLSTVTLNEMQAARKIIETNGGKIKNIFPPSVFIACIPRYILSEVLKSELIKEVSYTKLNPVNYQEYELSTRDAINLWNKNLEEARKAKIKKVDLAAASAKRAVPKEPFHDDLVITADLPKTKEEKLKKDQEYLQHWQLKKQELERQENIKRQNWLKKQGKSPRTVKLLSTPVSASSPDTQPKFGKAYGASYFDTSLYMAGDIAVGVFFAETNQGAWTNSEINDAFTEICGALNHFLQDEPNAHITFTFLKEISPDGKPKIAPDNYHTYVNDLRNIYNTHWAYMIVVVKGDGQAWALLHGPMTVLCSKYLREGFVVRHETMHIFGAVDQHDLTTTGATTRAGYLNVVNANAEHNDGRGFFGGAGERLRDLVRNGGPIGVYSRGQIGWRDADGDGLLDPLDTFPDTISLVRADNRSFLYAGKAIDKALLNEIPYNNYSNVTLNTISVVEYRINGGAWYPAQSKDGVFDSGEEEFNFSLPPLSNGRYLLEVRATNSVGNTEVSYAKVEIRVENSDVANIRPFATFSITPPKGSIDTNFVFDASESSDIEDNVRNIQVRWDFENDGIWDTAFSTTKTTSFKYASAGTKTVRLEVKDSSGLKDTINKEIRVADKNIAPYAFFTATPENQHGDSFDSFTVSLDATGSYDGEDDIRDLKVRWDFDDDGIWDTNYTNNFLMEHSYELPKSFLTVGRVTTPSNSIDLFVSGNYVYVTGGIGGLQIVDISNPNDPVLAGECKEALGSSIYILGNYAYLAGGKSLAVVDIGNPRQPKIVTTVEVAIGFDYATDVFIAGNYLYVLTVYNLNIFDITSPASLNLVSSSYNGGSALYVLGEYAYVAASDDGLKIVNITNPLKPVLIGCYDTPAYACDVYVCGNLAYVVDMSGGNATYPSSSIQIIDVSNPRFPSLVSSFNEVSNYPQAISVVGNYAYVADYTLGLLVIDISQPQTPILVSRAISNISTDEDLLLSVFVSGNYAYVKDSSSLQIVDISKMETEPTSRHWRIRMGVKDKNENTSQATRDVWLVTYNHPPAIEKLEVLQRSTPAVDLVSRLDTRGYARGVSVIGKYAYVIDTMDYNGLQIVDISNPQAPILVGSYDTTDRLLGAYIQEGYAYLLDLSAGILIVDITDPVAPKLVGKVNLEGGQFIPGAVRCVQVLGKYLYVAAKNFFIFDITNPYQPSLLSSYAAEENPTGMYISGNYAYLIYGSGRLQILNVEDHRAPILIGSFETRDSTADVYVSGNHAYVAASQAIKIIDISNPVVPTTIGSIDTWSNPAENVYLWGNYAYAWRRELGLQIIDISNPRIPRLIGSFPMLSRGGYGNICILGDYAYVSNGYWGLKIFRLREGFIPAVRAIGGCDLDKDATWDGLLEYRWDFGNDYIWDTRFSSSDEFILPRDFSGETISCQIRDRFSASKTITVNMPDNVAPFASLTINQGARYTRFHRVNLKLFAYDAGSGMGPGAKMQFYNDGENWSIEEDYAATRTWNLTAGDGEKRVYVRFKDAVGNLSESVPSPIVLDSTRPQFTDFSVVSQAIFNQSREFNATVTDAGSGVNRVLLCWRKRYGMEWGINHDYHELRMEPQGDNKFRVVIPPGTFENGSRISYYIACQDNAGNWKTTPTHSFRVTKS